MYNREEISFFSKRCQLYSWGIYSKINERNGYKSKEDR